MKLGLQHLVIIVTAFAASCAHSVSLTGGTKAPGAVGVVKVKKGSNGNSEITLKVQHLAAPAQVAEGSTAYVVWIQNIDHVAPAQNAGELKVDDNLSGSISTLTTLPTFDVTVTPETSAQVATPTGVPVLSGRVEVPN